MAAPVVPSAARDGAIGDCDHALPVINSHAIPNQPARDAIATDHIVFGRAVVSMDLSVLCC